MTIMKKTFIKWGIFFLLMAIVIILVIFLNNQNSKKANFINYPVNYSLCNNNLLEVKIYCTSDNLSFFDKDNIVSTTINDEEENSYQVKIENITKDNKKIIDNQDYYLINYEIFIPVQSEEVINLKKAKLNMINIRGEILTFNIGNISIVNDDFLDIVEVKKVMGTTKMLNNYSTLDTICVELVNSKPQDVTLKEVILISNVVETQILEQTIRGLKDYQLEIPLIYKINSFIDNVGIILVFDYLGNTYKQLINPYVLFKTTTNHTLGIKQNYEIY